MTFLEIFSWGFGLALMLYFVGWTMGHCFNLVGTLDDLAWSDRNSGDWD